MITPDEAARLALDAETSLVHSALSEEDQEVLVRLLPIDRDVWRSAAKVLLGEAIRRDRIMLDGRERALLALSASAQRLGGQGV